MASRPLSKRLLAMLVSIATGFRALLLRGAARMRRWFESRLVPALPLPLFLACTLAALELAEPKWLEPATSAATRLVLWVDRGMDEVPPPLQPLATLVTRVVYLIDGGLQQLLGWRPHLASEDTESAYPRSTFTRSLLGEWEPDEHMNVTLVTLTPEAYAHYLNRQAPVPRERLACVIAALAERLQAESAISREPSERQWQRPVVAIDIDVAPVEPKAVMPQMAQGVKGAFDCGLPVAPECPATASSRPAADPQEESMASALCMLASHAHVVAIAYPRPKGESRQRRNKFICRMDCGSSQGAGPCVHFASPMLVYAPQQSVHDYVTKYDKGNGTFEAFPGLGQIMASLWRHGTPVWAHGGERPYCPNSNTSDESTLDDRLLESSAMEFRHKKIALGPARTSVRYFDVDAPRQPAEMGNAYEQLRTSLVDLPQSRAYVLTIDSGTTEDKFLLPVLDVPVLGAWVHAAIAITESMNGGSSAFERYLEVLYWLILGLLYAAAVKWLMERLKQSRSSNPVWHDFVVVVVPLATSIVFLWFQAVFTTAPKIARGEAAIPALVILGMMVESYLGAHEGSLAGGAGHGLRPITLHGLARWMQWLGQYVWAVAIMVSLLFLLELEVSFTMLVAAGLVLGFVIVQVGQSWRLMPLPWR